MKQFLMMVALMIATTVAAQNSNLVNAYNYMKDGDLVKAAEYIDLAAANEATMVKEKTWRYRGDIYRMILTSPDAALKAQFPQAMDRAVESYMKANELDTKHEYQKENNAALIGLQGETLNTGNDAYAAKDYDKALALYASSQKIAKSLGVVDTNAIFNSAMAYSAKEDHASAVKTYQECLDLGYDKVEVYEYKATAQSLSGDKNGAIETTKAGLKRHPGQKNLLLDLVGQLLAAERTDEALEMIDGAIAVDPGNAVLHSIKGSLYDQKAYPKDGAVVSDEEIAKWSDLAEVSYKKAMELDQDLFDPYFNIGALINNRAASMYKKIEAIKDDALYEKARKDVDAQYLRAIPYFEGAHRIRPDDKTTIQQLKVLYYKAGDTAKSDAMKALLEK